MSNFRQISVHGQFVEAALKPCPWCKKTPHLTMPLDQQNHPKLVENDKTWIWRIHCDCRVSSEAKVSIRKTTKTVPDRFLEKLDELFDKWNGTNLQKAYEKKVLDLKMIPNLGIK